MNEELNDGEGRILEWVMGERPDYYRAMRSMALDKSDSSSDGELRIKYRALSVIYEDAAESYEKGESSDRIEERVNLRLKARPDLKKLAEELDREDE